MPKGSWNKNGAQVTRNVFLGTILWPLDSKVTFQNKFCSELLKLPSCLCPGLVKSQSVLWCWQPNKSNIFFKDDLFLNLFSLLGTNNLSIKVSTWTSFGLSIFLEECITNSVRYDLSHFFAVPLAPSEGIQLSLFLVDKGLPEKSTVSPESRHLQSFPTQEEVGACQRGCASRPWCLCPSDWDRAANLLPALAAEPLLSLSGEPVSFESASKPRCSQNPPFPGLAAGVSSDKLFGKLTSLQSFGDNHCSAAVATLSLTQLLYFAETLLHL